MRWQGWQGDLKWQEGLWRAIRFESAVDPVVLSGRPSPSFHRHFYLIGTSSPCCFYSEASVALWLPDLCQPLQLQVEGHAFCFLDFSSCVPSDSGADEFSRRAFCKGYQHFLTFQGTLYPLLFSVFPPFTLWYFPIFPPSDSTSLMNFPAFSSQGSSLFPSPMGSHLLYCISHSLYSVPLG